MSGLQDPPSLSVAAHAPKRERAMDCRYGQAARADGGCTIHDG